MKRLILVILSLFMLVGCTEKQTETTTYETAVSVTELSVPWIAELGTSWDEEGALTELPLNIPNGMRYNAALAFHGDLLFWGSDDHRENIRTLELCLFDLDTGSVTAEREIDLLNFTLPQVLGDSIFLCDSTSGTILELDHNLETVHSWHIAPEEANLYMGFDEILYIYKWDGTVTCVDLKTQERTSLLDESCYIEFFSVNGNTANLEYYHPDNGEKILAAMDMITGQILEPGLDKDFTSLTRVGGSWLCENYRDGSIVYIGNDSGEFLRADMDYDGVRLIDEKTLLLTPEDGCHISVHDLSGATIARAKLTATPYSQICSLIVPSETFGGYFLLIGDYGSSQRLLYWDISKGLPGENIPFEPIPKPEEEESQIKSRVEEIEKTYGLNILVGTDCETNFYDFTAEYMTDWDLVEDALDTLEDALENYPDGFFRQLRYGDVRSTEIHLTGTLTAITDEYVDTYEAFVQENYDAHVMVVDVTLADQSTYYHEFSHIIDTFLEWDAMNREDALFSDDGWSSLNPGWFPGYTYDYSLQQNVADYTAFVGTYSTINPTEDRAMVLEDAMMDYGIYTFENAEILLSKLDYYCRCIRDAFDTSGWPENTLWEQYLP